MSAIIGRTQELEVIKIVDFGAYLDGGDTGEILIPKRYLPQGCAVGDKVEVFVYFDSEDRIVATTEKPYAQVGQFAYLRVAAINPVGVFLDWGLQKDLLVPFREQQKRMEEGKSYAVYIYVDEETRLIAASTKLDRYFKPAPADYEPGREVDLLITSKSDLGFKAIVDGAYSGLLYGNEVFKDLKDGERVKGFVKKVREDGKMDISLRRPGYGEIEELSEKILARLEEAGGFIAVTDKSSPQQISDLFGASKKSYKKAVGALYRKRLIIMDEKGIKLV